MRCLHWLCRVTIAVAGRQYSVLCMPQFPGNLFPRRRLMNGRLRQFRHVLSHQRNGLQKKTTFIWSWPIEDKHVHWSGGKQSRSVNTADRVQQVDQAMCNNASSLFCIYSDPIGLDSWRTRFVLPTMTLTDFTCTCRPRRSEMMRAGKTSPA